MGSCAGRTPEGVVLQAMNLSGLLSVIEQTPSCGRLRDALRAQRPRLTVGVSDAAKPAAIAILVRDWPGPVLVVTSRTDRAEALAEELSAWLGEPERGLLFPERDSLPYERLAPAAGIVRDRLRAGAPLAGGGGARVNAR